MDGRSLPMLEALSRMGLADGVTLEPAAGGASGDAWVVRAEGRRFILRLSGSERVADARAAAMDAARASGLPVPEVIARASVGDGAALLLSYLPGTTLGELMVSAPDSAAAWARRMGALQRRLHGVLAPHGLPAVHEDGGHPFGAGRANDVPVGDVLLHLDWHPGNLLATDDGDTITGIVDWDNARRGNALLDLARTESMLTVDPAIGSLPAHLREGLAGVIAAWAEGYGPEASAIPVACRRWAGRVMVADLAPRYMDRPELLDPARRWAETAQ